MRVRELKLKDATVMLEWMHSDNVVAHLNGNFKEKKIEDCIRFIKEAQNGVRNIHKAIVDNNDEYMGTISLKNVTGDSAEFAIAMREVAMGKGFASYGMKEMLQFGFQQLGLQKIYWCVSPQNTRAVRFYDKNGYSKVDDDDLEYNGGVFLRNKEMPIFGIRKHKILWNNNHSVIFLL